MKNELTPILIGFPLCEEVFNWVVTENKSTDLEKINFERQIPHVTLWMGFVRAKQIKSLNTGLQKVFQNISIESDANELQLFAGKFGSVLSLDIRLTRELNLLQNRIHHFFEPFRETGNLEGNLDQDTVEYINNFPKKSLANYEPHITIGFSRSLNERDIQTKMTLKNPVMFAMGNYCTCISCIQ